LDLIAAIRSRAAKPGRAKPGSVNPGKALRLGIGDDCAILRPPPGHDIVVTTDLSLENVHFRRDWHPPESVGHRCLARGLSDLAAMGATPLAAFLSLAFPPELTVPRGRGKAWLDRFLDGFLALASRIGVPLAGGDTAQSPAHATSSPAGRASTQTGLAIADIILIGAVKRGSALLRSNARVGDIIYVTGSLGGSAAELLALQRAPKKFAAAIKASAGHPHLYPEPRIAAARALAARFKIRTGIDISDGLSTDLTHICEESGVAAELDAAAIPIHPLALQAQQKDRSGLSLDLALHGGEDYELLFTAPVRTRIPKQVGGVAVCPIGAITARKRRHPLITLREEDGSTTELQPRGWEHFRKP
jgi:thiamine-monophosphate kinase